MSAKDEKNAKNAKSDKSDKKEAPGEVFEQMPMVPLRDVVVFPHMIIPFVVGRRASVRALEEALAGPKRIFLATQFDAKIDNPTPEEIASVGVVANIVQSLKLPNGNIKVLVEGVERGRVIAQQEPDESTDLALTPGGEQVR